jgi:hypothetical protein
MLHKTQSQLQATTADAAERIRILILAHDLAIKMKKKAKAQIASIRKQATNIIEVCCL